MLARRTRKTISNNTRTAKYSTFGGIDISSSNDAISEFNTSDCLNMLPDSKGDLSKRYGIETIKFFDAFGPPSNIFNYGSDLVVVAFGELYTSADNYATSKGGLRVSQYISGFEQNDKLYIFTGKTGTNPSFKYGYVVFDGVSVEQVEGYIPTAYINSPNTGGGTALEEENRISNFTFQEFQKDSGDTTFQFFKSGLDSASVYIRNATTLEWDLQTLGTDYTQNLTTGLFTISAAIPDSSTIDGNDSVRIMGEKDNGLRDTIDKCNISTIYGGKTNISVWCAGNPDFPNYDFHTGVNRLGEADPTYFPIQEFDVVGGDDQAITGYGKQNDLLIITKGNRNTEKESTWLRESQITDDGIFFFIQEINSEIGGLAPGAVVLLDNSVWTVGYKGFNKVKPREELSENSLEPQSNFINFNRNQFSDVQGLIDSMRGEVYDYSRGITSVPSIDFEGKMYFSLTITNTVWVCDYQNLQLDQSTNTYVPQWYRLNNIAATCFAIKNGELYFGTRGGALSKFKNDSDIEPFVDEQEGDIAIFPPYPEIYDFYWTTKLTNLNTIQYTEDIEEVFVSIKGYSNTAIDLYARSNIDENYQKLDTFEMHSLVYSAIVYSDWVYGGSRFPRAFKSRVRIKNAEYVQFKLGGSTRYPATITNMEINISEGKEV